MLRWQTGRSGTTLERSRQVRLSPQSGALDVNRVALVLAAAVSFPLELAAANRGGTTGIPAFARKYKVTCAMCHAPIPRLTAVGEAFAANGFEFAPGEEPRDTIVTGDPLLRLQNSLPLAVRYDAYITAYSKRTGQQVIADAQTPWVIKLLSGGQVADRISYYTYFLLTERGEVAGLEDAYIQFTDVRGSGVNIIAGQFQVSDPLFKRELRLQYDDYQPYRLRVGISPADLTYDRGLMALWSPRDGTDLAVELVSGVGLSQANSDRQYDMDGYKNVALRLSQDVGPLRVGAFGYFGNESTGGFRNKVRVFGPDMSLPLGSKGELNLQAFRRWDDDPFLGTCTIATPCPTGNTSPFSTTVDAGFAEAIFWPGGPAGRWYFTALGNYIDAGMPVVSLRLGEQNTAPGFLERYITTGVGAHYLLRRNVRMMTEAHWDHERAQGRLVGGFTLAY